MFTFEIEKWVPKFILADKNGYAIAKALEAAIAYMNETISDGVSLISDYETMPEWRLDELAWEYNIPYDYSADVEIKRQWIGSLYSLYRLWGTPEGIVKYMAAYFEDTTLEENWEYGGDPFHFLVNFQGTWTPENIAWATIAINKIKNLRSVLDKYHYTAKWLQTLHFANSFYAADNGTYQVSKQDAEELDYYADENADMLLDEIGMPFIVEE